MFYPGDPTGPSFPRMLTIGLVPDYPAAMTDARRHVLIVGDRRRPGVSEGVAQHLPFLEQHLAVDAVDLDEAVDLSTIETDLIQGALTEPMS